MTTREEWFLHQQQLFEKYKEGRDLDDVDSKEVHELATIGLFHIGVSVIRQKITAKTTSLGIGLMGK